MLLENRVAVVTGGAQGIGAAIARRFVAEGAKVMIADVNDEVGHRTAAELGEEGVVAYTHCDVGERLDVRNMVAATLDVFGDIDVLVNNAGIVHAADFLDLKEEDFDRVLRINLKGAFLCGQAVARHLVERVKAGGRPGAIVNMSSINAVVAMPSQIPYAVSKGGVKQLTNVMALGLAKYGIRVNAIGPGSIMTDMLASVQEDDEIRRALLARTPLGRFADPSEMAAIAAFLASDEASYITGETIYADGGRLGLNLMVPVADDA